MQGMKPKIIYLLIGLLLTFRLVGQYPYSWRLTDEDGLPSTTIYDLFEDEEGYVWLGTSKGLVRYNGFEMKRFPTIDNELSNISGIRKDLEGTLWCQDFIGNLYFLRKDRLKKYRLEDDEESTITDYRLLKNGNLLVLNKGRLVEASLEGEVVHIYDFGYETVARLMISENTIINDHGFVTVENGIVGKKVSLEGLFKKDFVGLRGGLGAVKGKHWAFNMMSGNIYSVSDSIYFHANYADLNPNFDTVGTKELLMRMQELNGAMWCLTRKGAFNIETKQYLLPEYSISDVLVDREGNHWFSTLHSGVFIVPDMDFITFDQNHPDIEDSRFTRIIDMKDGNLAIGGISKLLTLNLKTKKVFTHLKLGHTRECEAIGVQPTNKSLLSAFGRIYGAKDLANYPLLSRGLNIKQILFFEKNLLVRDHNSVLIEVNDPIWLRVFQKSDLFRLLSKGNLFNMSSKSKVIRFKNAIFDEERRTLWLAFANGLIKVDQAGAERIQYLNDPIEPRYLCQVDDGILISTLDGILKYDYIFNSVHLFYEDEDKEIPKRMVVHENRLWFTHANGLGVMDLFFKERQDITKLNGLISGSVNDFVVTNDKLWLATNKGIQALPIREDYSNPISPRLMLGDIFVSKQERSEVDLQYLSHFENDILVDVSLISIKSRGQAKILYKVDGLSADWVTLSGGAQRISLLSLSPGDYKLRIKAINENGIEGEEKVIPIVIQAPFWQKWWFISSCIGAVILIIAIYIRSRLQRQRNRHKVKQELAASQLTALKVQMNPHFIFNSLNSIQEYIVVNESRLASSYLGKFADLIRIYLDNSQKDHISIAKEIHSLKLYLELEQLRFENKLHYHFVNEGEVSRLPIRIPPMLIQPFVENSIKHGFMHKANEDWQLNMEFKYNEHKKILTCIIEDNGVGRDASMKINASKNTRHESFSSEANRTRVELLNLNRDKEIGVYYKDLKDTDGKGIGTIVEIKIPVNE